MPQTSTPVPLIELLARDGVVTVEADPLIVGAVILRLAFFSSTAVVSERFGEEGAWLIGELPPGRGTAKLTRQGALSVIGQLREQKLGIDDVDDAFLVSCDDDGFALLTRCADPLRALVTDRAVDPIAQIHLERDQLRILWPRDDVAVLPALWERLVSLRAGA